MTLDVDRRSVVLIGLYHIPALNKHHEFEHLCRGVARVHFGETLIPATGPVGAGGDQGRDFQSFPIRVGNTAYACTAQQDKLTSKIIDDVRQILSTGDRPGRIVVFLAKDLAVGRQNRVREFLRREVGVAPEIYDGLAIAEMIAADDDLMKLAVRHLDLPSALVSGDQAPRAAVVADRPAVQATPDCREFIDGWIARREVECRTPAPEPATADRGAGGDPVDEIIASLAGLGALAAEVTQRLRAIPEDTRGRGDPEAARALVAGAFNLSRTRWRNRAALSRRTPDPSGLSESDIVAHLAECRTVLRRRAQLLTARNAGSLLRLRVLNTGGADLPGAVVRLSLPAGATAVPAQVADDPGPALPARPVPGNLTADPRSALGGELSLLRAIGQMFPPERPGHAYHATGDITEGSTVEFAPVDLPVGASVQLPAIPVTTHHSAAVRLHLEWRVESPRADEAFGGTLSLQVTESTLAPEDLLKGHLAAE